MIVYKDQTFCFSDCTNKNCDRYASEKDKDNAEKIGLPMSMADFSNDCDDYKPSEDES